MLSFSQETKKKSPFSGNFDLGMNFTKNIESTFQLNNVFVVNYKKGKSNFNIANNIALISKTGEEELLNKGTQDFKYSYDAKKLNTNLSLQHLYDISRSIKSRFTTGLGLSYNFINKERNNLQLGLSALREKNTPLEGDVELQNRLSTNFDLAFKINKSVNISLTNHYQPNIEEAGDFRWKSNVSFRISLSPKFMLSINSTYNYDSVPAEGIPESDYQFINSISYTF